MRLSRFARWAALLGWAGTLLGWLAWLAPAHPWVAIALVLPLFAPLPGLYRGRRYTYAWTSLLALGYLVWPLTEFSVRGGDRAAALVPLLASVLLFVGCLCYVRWRASEDSAAA